MSEGLNFFILLQSTPPQPLMYGRKDRLPKERISSSQGSRPLPTSSRPWYSCHVVSGAAAVHGAVRRTILRGRGFLLPRGVGLFHLHLGLGTAVMCEGGAAAVHGAVRRTILRGRRFLLHRGVGLFHLLLSLGADFMCARGATAVRGGVRWTILRREMSEAFGENRP